MNKLAIKSIVAEIKQHQTRLDEIEKSLDFLYDEHTNVQDQCKLLYDKLQLEILGNNL